MRRVVTLLVLAALAGAGCARNPVTGRPNLILVPEASEREMGREEAEKVRQTMGLLEDSELTAYVSKLGARLAAPYVRDGATFEFHVVDVAEPNAFALPGGHVYVSRGLLALSNSEDELANVIGHEIGHVLARHASRRLTLAAPFALATGVGALATGIVSPTLGRAVADIGSITGGLVIAPYSREQERDADRVGMELAARAGWDPAAMATLLHTLEREEQSHPDAKPHFNFFASHPSTPERVAATAKLARGMDRAPASPIAGERISFLRSLDGLLVGDDPAQGVFAENRFLHPELNFTLAFPEKWATQNTRESVAAVAPDGTALIVLESAKGANGQEAARIFASGAGIGADAVVPLEHAGRSVPHVEATGRGERGDVSVDISWIDAGGAVYKITGVAEPEDFPAYRGQFHLAALSLRELTSDERKSIRDSRLRIREAKAGQSLGEFAEREKSSWTADQIAIANGLEPESVLPTVTLLKVAVPEPYRARH